MGGLDSVDRKFPVTAFMILIAINEVKNKQNSARKEIFVFRGGTSLYRVSPEIFEANTKKK